MFDEAIHYGLLHAVQATLRAGGLVAWVLVLLSWMLLSALLYRGLGLRRGFSGSLAEFLARPDAGGDGVVASFVRQARLCSSASRRRELARRRVGDLAFLRGVIRALVGVAPMLGLLGTVGGMVETFSSLTGAAQHTDASVADGISTALVTTQLGLSIGVLGFLLSRYLERREQRLVAEIDQVCLLLELRPEAAR